VGERESGRAGEEVKELVSNLLFMRRLFTSSPTLPLTRSPAHPLTRSPARSLLSPAHPLTRSPYLVSQREDLRLKLIDQWKTVGHAFGFIGALFVPMA
jgi:hypothetical protein